MLIVVKVFSSFVRMSAPTTSIDELLLITGKNHIYNYIIILIGKLILPV